MKIHEIENLSAAELKARRDEVTEAAKAEPAAVVAVRYVKTLMDAKRRDELLAEQGKTITALQDGLEAAKAQTVTTREAFDTERRNVQDVTARLQEVERMAVDTVAGRDATIADKQAVIEQKNQTIAELTARAGRLKGQAEKHAAAINEIARRANDAIASRQIEAADAPDAA